jgi:transposase
MPPCLIGMEACVGAHHLSRKLKALGHDARLMPAKYAPLFEGTEERLRDAEAIAEAVQRPTMKFVATKTADQLDLQVLHRVRERLVSQRIEELSGEITELAKQDSGCDRLMSIPGIGPLISSAMVAAIGTGDVFSKGRDFAAWLGLVPKQISTGDRIILGKISKRGNRYLRTLFVQAAWVVLVRIKPSRWESHMVRH